ncbi:hypothetical protein FM113_03365 [Leucobacter sp. 7(1)]|uniref:hypothetical protein n=1 Tax=Leucobacter sp. 7(1) TaxID=1255613 RepID=UPI00097E9D94|nr:hypothetical protein [Leucobacter sp. 7(1)]SJN08581.1 hypothetical protein FM113_03365 [Leucobacter sp. 7(1)]
MTLLRIRADLPLGWEDPDTLRVGFERAIARVRDPSPAQQRLIGRIRTGVHSEDWPEHTRAAGATPREARALLAAVAPALDPGPKLPPWSERTSPLRVFLNDGAWPVPGLAAALIAADTCVQVETVGTCDVVLHVERYLEPLERAQRWLLADLPHLLLRFSDTQFTVGPLVLPPGQPCHTCASLRAIDADPGLPAFAAQLMGSRPASETPIVGAAAGVAAAAVLDAWHAKTLAGQDWTPTANERGQTRYPVARGRLSGAPKSLPIPAHPECACGALG